MDTLGHQREMISQIEQELRLESPQDTHLQIPEKMFNIQFESHATYSDYITKRITTPDPKTDYFDSNFFSNLTRYLKNLQSTNLKLQNDHQWFLNEFDSKNENLAGLQGQNSDLRINMELLGKRVEISENLISELRENNDYLRRSVKISSPKADSEPDVANLKIQENNQKLVFDIKVLQIELGSLVKSYDDLKKINQGLTFENQKLSSRLDCEKKIADCLRDDKINFNFDSKILNDEIESLLKTVQE